MSLEQVSVFVHYNKCKMDVNFRIDYSSEVNILTGVEDFIFSGK